jgi:hypothetical protein
VLQKAGFDSRFYPITFATMIGRTFVLMFLGTVAAAIGLSYLLASVLPAEPDWIPHLATHASVGVPVSVLAWFGWRERARSRFGTSAGTTLVLLGISIIGAAQLLEAAAARLEYPQMGTLHGSAGALTPLGILVSVFGLAVFAGILIFRRPPPRWVLIAGGLLVTVLAALFVRTLAVGF